MIVTDRNYQRILLVAFAGIVLQLCFGLMNACAETAKPLRSAEEQLRVGERMYREGILASGEPMQAVVKGDIAIPGTSFTCVSCHLRSGLGSIEGGVFTPPTTGKILYQPLNLRHKNVEADKKYFPPIEHRPAYTDETLAAALRGGVEPTGAIMNAVMPRYLLEDADMAALIAYLKTLSSELSPGVTDTTIRFATVITDDVPVEEYEAMLAPLEKYMTHKNNMVQLFKKEKRSERMAGVMVQSGELLYKKLFLSRWMLKGPKETWRSQLEEYYRKEPVFALLGGISNSDWKPIHDFCEVNHIPALFPQTNFPVVSDTDWYTLYLSKGYFQEGEGAARYLNNRLETMKSPKVVQIIRASLEANALAEGFQNTWRVLGHDDPLKVILKTNEQLSKESLQQMLSKEQPAAIVLWDGAGAVSTLEMLSGDKSRPEIVLVAGSYLGQNLWSITEQSRDFTYITYPYRLPQQEGKFQHYIEPFKNSKNTALDPILKHSFITTQMLTYALMDLRGNYYRDNFFDVIGMMADQLFPLYERMSFGPGQRYASKGCYIVQLGNGPKPELIKKSDWVIH